MEPTIAKLYVITTRPSTGNKNLYTSTMFQCDMMEKVTRISSVLLFSALLVGFFLVKVPYLFQFWPQPWL